MKETLNLLLQIQSFLHCINYCNKGNNSSKYIQCDKQHSFCEAVRDQNSFTAYSLALTQYHWTLVVAAGKDNLL